MEGNPKLLLGIGAAALICMACLRGDQGIFNSLASITSLENLRHSFGFAVIRHPALKISSYELPTQATIDKADLQRLCHMVNDFADGPPDLGEWQTAFEKIEVESAGLLADRCRGQKESIILEMLGSPAFKGLVPAMLSKSKTDRLGWFYHVGVTDAGLFVLLDKGRCVDAVSASFAEIGSFESDIADKMVASSKGRTKDEIIAVYGLPERIRSLDGHEDMKPVPDNCTVFYGIGLGDGVSLDYSNGVCIKTGRLIIVH